MPNPTDSNDGVKPAQPSGLEASAEFNARWGLSLDFVFSQSAESRRVAPPAPTYLDHGVHAILDPVAGMFDSSGRASDEVVGYTKGFLKTVPMFMKGPVPVGVFVAGYAADEAKPSDSGGLQLLDAGLGMSKAILMKGTMAGCHKYGLTPGTTGLSLGLLNRATSVGLTRQSYIDETGQPSIAHGLTQTALATFNPISLAVDAASYGAADIAWGRISARTRGTAVFNPSIGSTLTAGTMGVTSGFGNELHRQITVDHFIDPLLLARRTLLQGSVDALAGHVGGIQARNYMKLPRTDSPTAIAEARATPFQRGELVDAHQAKLRDGEFVPTAKVTGLTTETWMGTIRHAGEDIPAVFRPSNGTESFARRMQNEIASYGLSTLGFENNMPVTVARSVEIKGTKYSGFIQEMKGKNLADFLTPTDGTAHTPANVLAQFRSNSPLQDAFTRNFVQRMILGEWDNHAKNMSVYTQNGKVQVAGFDLQDALPQATSTMHLTPRPGLRYSWESTNLHLYNEIAGKAIPADLRVDLSQLHQTYNNQPGRLQMQAFGLTPSQVDGVLGITNWFSTNGVLPREQETYFLREHLLKPIKPYVKRLLKGPSVPQAVQDQAAF